MADVVPITRRFEAAEAGRLTADWPRSGTTINRDLYMDLPALRARSRKAAQNNDHVKRYIELVKTNVVGPRGFVLRGVDDRVATAWADWSRMATADHMMSWREALSLIVESVARDGEIMGQHVRGTEAAGNRYGYALHLLEPEHLDEKHDRVVDAGTGNQVVMGVELGAFRRREAYHVLTSNPLPGATQVRGGSWRVRIPSRDVLHPYVMHWPSQVRGYPWVHSALLRLHMAGQWETAQTVALREAANKLGFLTTPDGDPGTLSEETLDHDGVKAYAASSRMAEWDVLPQGVTVDSYDPTSPTTSHNEFLSWVLRSSAMGLNVGYHSLTGDTAGMSWSNLRQVANEERDAWRCLHGWAIDHAVHKVFDEWLFNALGNNAIRGMSLADYETQSALARWRGRGWPATDPDRESKSQERYIANGLRSRQQYSDEAGLDWYETMEDLAEEKDEAMRIGIDITPTIKDDDALAVMSAQLEDGNA